MWRSTKKPKSGIDPDVQNLILGDPQIVDVMDAVDHCEVRIALLHHPPNSMWFAEFDQARHELLSCFDFVLRGHEHRANALGITSITGDEWMHFASGALYTTDYPKGFNAVIVNLESGLGKMYLWEYDHDRLKWRADTRRIPNGWIEFPIPKQLRQRVTRPNSRSAAS